MSRINPPYNHLGLFPQCGICADTIRHERTVARMFWPPFTCLHRVITAAFAPVVFYSGRTFRRTRRALRMPM
ncbi:hypothetical protein GGR51DRAFT_524734 [Nemania sp. FL0031]|nr:hypothetical protein GGR51DRAFT_524734 [Nemania sp. FL0031]